MSSPSDSPASKTTSTRSEEPTTLQGWLFRQLTEFWVLARNSYFAIDRRTLGLTRILLGFYLITDLFRRGAAWEDMFSDKGILPTWVILERPQSNHFSFLHGFTTAPELWALWMVMLATFVALLVGYKTKVAQILSLIFVTSMNGRVLLVENGGYVVQSLLLLWTCFMPLGDRFSVDGLLASMRRRHERTADELNDRTEMVDEFRMKPFISVIGLVLCLQIFAIYYFNFIHKFGPGWKRDFNATHYVMYVDRMVTPIIAATRDYIPFRAQQFLTMAVIASEGIIPFCALLPQLVIGDFDVKLWVKRVGLTLINFLHIGFGSTFVLGPFAWALCVFSSLFLSYEDWDVTIRALRRTKRARTVVFDETSGATLWLCRILARLDRFGLLTFDAARTEEERALRIGIVAPTTRTKASTDEDADDALPARTVVSGHGALAQIVAALPIGPVFAWMLRVPPLSWATDRALSAARGRASKFFGFTVARPEGKPVSHLVHVTRIGGRLFSELACVVMFLAALNQALVELWSTQKRYKEWVAEVNKEHGWKLDPQEDEMRTLTHKMRFLQGWFMFSPNPVTVDGTIVVDAVTADGRHLDPFSYAPPDFDLIHAKSYGYNQIWSDYFNRIQGDGARAYQKPMLEYLRRLPERTGKPNDTLVSGEVYWVSDHNPKPRTTNSYGQQKTLLFTFGPTGGPNYQKPGT
ncbi:MAG: hypothetical protein HOW73_09290 [Polyangiaceae bacterium]|nr:hypothetical protein [Polyangiaceae bacterium]